MLWPKKNNQRLCYYFTGGYKHDEFSRDNNFYGTIIPQTSKKERGQNGRVNRITITSLPLKEENMINAVRYIIDSYIFLRVSPENIYVFV